MWHLFSFVCSYCWFVPNRKQFGISSAIVSLQNIYRDLLCLSLEIYKCECGYIPVLYTCWVLPHLTVISRLFKKCMKCHSCFTNIHLPASSELLPAAWCGAWRQQWEEQEEEAARDGSQHNVWHVFPIGFTYPSRRPIETNCKSLLINLWPAVNNATHILFMIIDIMWKVYIWDTRECVGCFFFLWEMM